MNIFKLNKFLLLFVISLMIVLNGLTFPYIFKDKIFTSASEGLYEIVCDFENADTGLSVVKSIHIPSDIKTSIVSGNLALSGSKSLLIDVQKTGAYNHIELFESMMPKPAISNPSGVFFRVISDRPLPAESKFHLTIDGDYNSIKTGQSWFMDFSGNNKYDSSWNNIQGSYNGYVFVKAGPDVDWDSNKVIGWDIRYPVPDNTRIIIDSIGYFSGEDYKTIIQDVNSESPINFFTLEPKTPTPVPSPKPTPTLSPIQNTPIGQAPNRVLIGASRWDAWVGNTGSYKKISMDNIQILSPQKFRYRTPFFATILGDNEIYIETTQASMDQEIRYAKHAGIDYWAFQYYPQTSGFHIPLNTYLTSKSKNDVKFCYIFHDAHLPTIRQELALLISRMKMDNYVTVDNKRPLVYLMGDGWTFQDVETLRNAASAVGLPPIYIVVMGYHGLTATQLTIQLGGQATSAYVRAGSGGISYNDFAKSESEFWQTYLNENHDFIPFVTTGWDPRPIGEFIDSLPLADQAATRQWYPTRSDPNFYVSTASASGISNHLKSALDFVQKNQSCKVPNTVLMYSWNEFTEGGWLCPVADGGTQRLDAIKTMLVQYYKNTPGPTSAVSPIPTGSISSGISDSSNSSPDSSHSQGDSSDSNEISDDFSQSTSPEDSDSSNNVNSSGDSSGDSSGNSSGNLSGDLSGDLSGNSSENLSDSKDSNDNSRSNYFIIWIVLISICLSGILLFIKFRKRNR